MTTIDIPVTMLAERWREFAAAYEAANTIDSRDLNRAFNALVAVMKPVEQAAHLRAERITLASGAVVTMTQAQIDAEDAWNRDGDVTNYWNTP